MVDEKWFGKKNVGSTKKEEEVVKSESDNEYANEEHNTELPSEAPGAVVCGNTLRNNNATMFVNIATRDNHGDAVSSPEKDFLSPPTMQPFMQIGIYITFAQ